MIELTISVGTVGYTVAAAAYLLLTLQLLVSRSGWLLLVAGAVSMAWTAAVAYVLVTPAVATGNWPATLAVLEAARSISWLLVLGATTWSGESWAALRRRARGSWIAVIILSALVVVALAQTGLLGIPSAIGLSGLAVGLSFSILGMLLIEILYRNTRGDQRWHIKFLCLGTGALFAYDLFFYGDAMLYGGISHVLYEARGPVQALVVPMLAVAVVRSRTWRSSISISRDIVLRSTTLLASGIYLFLMAVTGYFLGGLDRLQGPVLQIVFFVGAAAVLVIVLFSGTSRAYLKVLISKHFFQGRYDWRREWLRFMATLSAEQSSASLEERAIRAVADIVESPGGAMWLVVNERCEFAHGWNLAPPELDITLDKGLGHFLQERGWVVDIREAKRRPEAYPGLDLPAGLKDFARAWLLVPLYHDRLAGFILLAPSRAPRRLDWEDYDLLKTVGRQVASYLSEQQALRALNQAREFEIFNRRFAFVVHDIKNLISQLSVLGSNFEKYGEKPAFRDDVAESLHEAAAKMKRLMARIDSAQVDPHTVGAAALAPLIDQIVAEKSSGGAKISFDCRSADLQVAGDRDRLEAVIGHLIQNAVDAVGDRGEVKVALESTGRAAVLLVSDDGPGMDAAFLRNELFQPFRSTKEKGMGIGAYQCREYARELGGNLDALSRLGEGTTMRVTLPILQTIEAPKRMGASAGGT